MVGYNNIRDRFTLDLVLIKNTDMVINRLLHYRPSFPKFESIGTCFDRKENGKKLELCQMEKKKTHWNSFTS